MQKPIKIAVLDMYNGVANQGMRCIKSILGDYKTPDGQQLMWHVFDVRSRNEVPHHEDYDIFISSGGPGSPLNGEGVTGWETNYFNLIDSIWNHNAENEENKKYVFLICHSFQMVAHHFGLATLNRRKSTSFGVFPMHPTEAGLQEAVLENLPNPFYAVDSRDWQLVQPDNKRFETFGAKILAFEKERPNIPLERAIMAIRFSNEFFGTQFHPEADALWMTLSLNDPKRKDQVIAEHGEEKYYDMLDHLDDPDKIMLTQKTVIQTFLNLSVQALQEV
ncbi:MAG: GMP synthase [Verrucomicrobia bacterium]|nr:GMP synthase [Cytophagales bacterium]